MKKPIRSIALITIASTFAFILYLYSEIRSNVAHSRLISTANFSILISTLGSAIFASVLIFSKSANASKGPSSSTTTMSQPQHFKVQVVGIQWLNPLNRRDYPTEWQLLWTQGLARPNNDDDMLRTDPELFSSVKAIASIASGNKGKKNFEDYHFQYIYELVRRFHDNYFSNPNYFYNVHSSTQRSRWRELAGIRIEYALPNSKFDPIKAGEFAQDTICDIFSIGNVNMPTLWSRATPPDVRVTAGAQNAGFTSLSNAILYLQEHPTETAWAMGWDAPSRPLDTQINENLVLLILAGPNYKTERKALAWIGLPATKQMADFKAADELPPPAAQAWQATFDAAARNADKTAADIGYVVHDANNVHPQSSARLRPLAQTIATKLPNLDFTKQTFNTSALLGEMGAGSALTNVALAIGYANHFGKNVLVAGTTDLDQPTAVVVTPPAVVRPIDPDKPWFRARASSYAYLPWWGLRDDAPEDMQGFSE